MTEHGEPGKHGWRKSEARGCEAIARGFYFKSLVGVRQEREKICHSFHKGPL